MAYIDTPRTDVGNATLAVNGIEDMSFEKSFVSPKKRPHDLVSQMRTQRGQPLRTPSARAALTSRPNPTATRRSGEFTPLLQSITKRNALQGKENAPVDGIKTPAFLKSGYIPKESPALPNHFGSSMYGSDQSFLVDNPVELPQIASSSAQSTPVAQLPKGGQGVLEDQRNLMTLREQENIIDKVEKENFGLKLKIHFLEELLKKSDPNLNQNALKENTDLRVDKVQLQKELAKIRKALSQSEKLAETLRQQTRENQIRAQQDEADQELQNELKTLKRILGESQAEVEYLKDQLANDQRDQEFGKLHDDIEDLEFQVREKQRLVDTKDDEIEILNTKLQKAEGLEKQLEESNHRQEKTEELENVIQRLRNEVRERDEELEELQETEKELRDEVTQAHADTKEANEERDFAEREKQAAVDDLEELRSEMADKSFTTKGLSRQLEEKATKYESENRGLKEDIQQLEEALQDAPRESHAFKESLEEQKEDHDFNQRQLQDEIESLKQAQAAALQTSNSSHGELDKIRKELESKSDEKELLQTRHDALTIESQNQQRDLSSSRKQIEDLQKDLEEEKQMSLDNERSLRNESKREHDRLSQDLSALQRRLDTERGNTSNQQDLWASERREIQLEKEQVEQRATGLQRTVERLQASQGSLSNKEAQLQNALESEQQRHRDEQSLLSRQIDDLREDLEKKRKSLDENRSEILHLKEEQRLSARDSETSLEKIQALEDEVIVLQSSLEDDSERAKADLAAARQEAENVRRQLLSAKQDISRLESEVSDARAQIEAFQGDIQAGQGSKEQLVTRVRELETQVNRLRTDKQNLQDEVSRIQTAHADARAEIDTFQLDLRAGRGSNEQLSTRVRDLESQLVRIRNEKQSVEDELIGANIEFENFKSSSKNAGGNDASILRRDLATSRAKEIDFLQKESRLNEDNRSLRRQISQLETRLHEAELAKISASDNVPASVSPGQRSEVVELRRQLHVSHSESTTLRQQLKDANHSSREQLSQAANDLLEYQTRAAIVKEKLDTKVADLELQLKQQQATAAGNVQTISRLRTRITSLESELKESRNATITESQMATERADLHRMLQETKLEAEDMAHLAQEQAEQLEIVETREKQLASNLKLVRKECVTRQQNEISLEKQLKSTQIRLQQMSSALEDADDVNNRAQDDLKRHVRFMDQTVTNMEKEVHSGNTGVLNQRHEQELAEIRTQLEWMKAKLRRESSHKNALIYEKQYLEKEIDTFEACNRINLTMLRRIIPRRSAQISDEGEMKYTLRQVGLAVVSAIRMRNMARKWTNTRERYEPKVPAPGILAETLKVKEKVKSKDIPERSNRKDTSGAESDVRPRNQKVEAPTPRLVELKKSLVAESKAAAELLGRHSSSKDFNAADAQNFVAAMAATVQSFQKTNVGHYAPSKVATQTDAPSIVSKLRYEQAHASTNIPNTPQNEASRLLDSSNEVSFETEEELQDEPTEPTQGQNRGQVRDDACLTIDSGTFDLFKWAGRQKEKETVKVGARSDRLPKIASRKPATGTCDDEDECVTIDSEVSDWYRRSTSRQDITVKSLIQDDMTSQLDQLNCQKGKRKPASMESDPQKNRQGFQREKGILTQDISEKPRKGDMKTIFPVPDHQTLRQEKASTKSQPKRLPSQSRKLNSKQGLPTASKDKSSVQVDVSSNLSSVSSIYTSDVANDDDAITKHTKTATMTGRDEWWASIKEGSERPFEGQMKIKWKGFVAPRDPEFLTKSTPEKDQAIKKAMEKLALGKTMQAVRDEARYHAKDGALGKRKFQGRFG